MKQKLFILFIVLAISSCKSNKATSTSKADMKLLKTVLNKYQENSFNKKTVKASLKIKYKGKKNVPMVNGSLRIEKDKIIWLSISKFISVAKLKITPYRVQYYNNLDQTYFDGDFSLLGKILGTEVNFQQVQSILLGEAIYPLDSENYNVKTQDDSYIFTPKQNDVRFNLFFWLDSQNFKIKKQEIRQNNNEKLLSLQFTEFENIENTLFPKHLYVLAKDKDQQNTIHIDYKSIKFNLALRFPFSIPKGYQKIKL